MIDKLMRSLQDAGDMLRDQASSFKEGAKDKGYQIIDDWLQIFPKLEIYGLEITSFALSVAISPSLDVELRGKNANFSQERLQQILDENKKSTALTSVFSTIKTTYMLHRRTYATLRDPLIVKIRIRISPEIKVIIGMPTME
jgi:hypothetical protein